MAYHLNTQTGQLEDENGNPAPPGAIPMDQMAPAGGAPTSFAANQRAGADLSQPLNVGGMPAAGMPEPVGAQVPQPMPEPPPPVMPQSTRQTTVSREVPTKLEKGLVGQIQSDADKASELARQEGEIAQRKAGVEATGAQSNFESAQTTEANVAAEQEKRNAVIQAAQAKIETDRAKYESEKQNLAKMDIKDMYEGRPGALIAKAIALALGTFGSALSHSPNAAAEIISANENAWYKLQEAKINKQKDVVNRAEGDIATSRQNFEGARQAKADAMGDLRLAAAARADTIAMKALAEGARIGTDGATIQSQKIAQTAQQIAHQHLLQYQEGLRAKVTSETQTTSGGPGGPGGAGRAPTESEAKMAFLAQQMKGELDTIQKNPALSQGVLSKMQNRGITSEAADTTAAKGLGGAAVVGLARTFGVVPKSKYEGMTGQEQLVANAWDNLTEKYARVLTGAGMPEGEARRLALQDAPHGGDAPEVVAQKLARMKAAADQFMSLAPRASGMVAPPMAGAGPAARAPAPQMAAQDQAAVTWAKSHPSDPRAKQILSMHGM